MTCNFGWGWGASPEKWEHRWIMFDCKVIFAPVQPQVVLATVYSGVLVMIQQTKYIPKCIVFSSQSGTANMASMLNVWLLNNNY